MKYVAVTVLIIFSTLFLVNSQLCMSLNSTNLEEIWQKYKERHTKNYQQHIEERRKEAWLKNCEKIKMHNEKAMKGTLSFTLASNPLADMTLKHYHSTMVKLLRSKGRDVADPEVVGNIHIDYENVPKEIDWRKKGFETPPNNQKDCGSCYAFSIAHSIQAQIFKQTNVLEPLSEQQIVDCSLKSGNHGCAGGSLRNTLKYLEHSGGLMGAKDYPYSAKQTTCRFRRSKVLVNLTSWAILPARDERAMEAIVANVGPVAASINASPHTFQLYKTGVYDDSACSQNVVNHAMLIVGYTKEAWILKNWWGKRWGEDGYMRLKKNQNQCGIANYVAYVIV